MSNFFENNYYNTYYYSNIISNILTRDIELIRFIGNFFSDEGIVLELAKPYDKHSAFHKFIHSIIWDFLDDDMDQYDQKLFNYYKSNNYPLQSLYIDLAMEEFGLNDSSFEEILEDKPNIEYSDIEEYRDDLKLRGKFEELIDQITEEVFYLMFNNRDALLRFNHIVASYLPVDITSIEEPEVKLLFNDNGLVKRTNIPEWAKRAVFFRDRGRCCLCMTDLSGTLSLLSEKHYDHIIPLAQGGLNDVSNLQLLCSDCNRKKSGHKIETSSYYESWY